MRNIITTTTLILFGLIASIAPALAQTSEESTEIPADPSSSITTVINRIINLLNTGIDYLFAIGGSILIAMIIWGGFRYITGSAESGKKTITAAIIGLAIMVFSYVIIYAVIGILGGSGSSTISEAEGIAATLPIASLWS